VKVVINVQKAGLHKEVPENFEIRSLLVSILVKENPLLGDITTLADPFDGS
jgi:hypothetical protein